MKWICICFGFFVLPLTLPAEGVDHLIADAEQLEQRGETDSAINVLKSAEHASPENIQIEKLLARQYVLKVDDASDPAVKKTYAERIVHHAEYAKALDALGDTVAARQQWSKVAELKPIWAQDRRYQAMAMQRLQTER